MKTKKRRRRLNTDLPEPLYLALSVVCDRLAMSKADFVQSILTQSIKAYCAANPKIAAETLLDLMAQLDEYLLDGTKE